MVGVWVVGFGLWLVKNVGGGVFFGVLCVVFVWGVLVVGRVFVGVFFVAA